MQKNLIFFTIGMLLLIPIASACECSCPPSQIDVYQTSVYNSHSSGMTRHDLEDAFTWSILSLYPEEMFKPNFVQQMKLDQWSKLGLILDSYFAADWEVHELTQKIVNLENRIKALESKTNNDQMQRTRL